MATGDIAQTVEHARSAVQLIPEDDHLYRGAATALLGLASWSSGDLDRAFASYADGMANLRQGGYIIDAIGGSMDWPICGSPRGGSTMRWTIYQQGLLLASELGSRAPRGTADMYLGMSQLYWEWNDLEAAVAPPGAERSTWEKRPAFRNFPGVCGLRRRQVRANLGDLEGAYALLEAAEQRYVSDMFPNVRPIPAMRARVRIAQGRLDDAFAWARDSGYFRR